MIHQTYREPGPQEKSIQRKDFYWALRVRAQASVYLKLWKCTLEEVTK